MVHRVAGVVAIGLLALVGAGPVGAAEPSYINSLRVLDNGTFVRWDFAVCTPTRSHLEFEIEWFQGKSHRVNDQFSPATQGRNCGRYTLGLRTRTFFKLGARVRTRVNIYLGGVSVIHSRFRTFTPT